MKFQNPSLNSVLNGRKDERMEERTSQNQYAPHFFKVGGINMKTFERKRVGQTDLKSAYLCNLVKTKLYPKQQKK